VQARQKSQVNMALEPLAENVFIAFIEKYDNWFEIISHSSSQYEYLRKLSAAIVSDKIIAGQFS